MALLKRKHIEDESEAESSSQASFGEEHPDSDVDIAAALTGEKIRKTKRNGPDSGSEDDFEELEALIKDSVAKRDKKEGTKLLKQTKGKSKITKGEVGGGSFQSMGK